MSSSSSVGSTSFKNEGQAWDRNKKRREAKARSPRAGLNLVDRDLELLEFCLEMKFAPREALYRKFFKNLKSGATSTSQRWCDERLAELKNAGFLKHEFLLYQQPAFFLATAKARELLSVLTPERELVDLTKEIDKRFIDHDVAVTRCRLALEQSGRARNWVSEKRVFKDEKKYFQGLHRDLYPDAIYLSRANRRVALEMEISQKAPSQYQKKIDSYLKLSHIHRDDPNAVKQVLFVAMREPVFEKLFSMTEKERGVFFVLRFDDLMNIPHIDEVLNEQKK